MAAFELARDQGADGVELDVQPSLDGELVVIHDVTLDRTTSGSGNVFQTSWDELRTLDAGSWFSEQHGGEPVPRLADAVALKGLRLEIELKGHGLGFLDDVLQCILAADALDRVEFTSFNVPLLLRFEQRESSAQIGLFTHRQQPWMDDAAFEYCIVGPASVSGFDVVHVYARDITPPIVTRLHGFGMLAHANDAETRHDVQRVIDVGADRLTIKDPRSHTHFLRDRSDRRSTLAPRGRQSHTVVEVTTHGTDAAGAGLQPASRAVVHELRAVLDLVGELADDQWQKPTNLEGWSVLALVAHLAATPAGLTDGLVGAREGRTLPSRPTLQSPRPGPTITTLRRRVDELARVHATATASELDRPWPRPGDGLALPGTTALGLALIEVGLHLFDLQAATLGAAPLSEPVITSARQLLPAWLIFSSGAAPRPSATTSYRIHGERIDVGFLYDDDRWATPTLAAATCDLYGDDSDLVLFLAGRLPAAQLRTDQPGLAEHFKRYLPGP